MAVLIDTGREGFESLLVDEWPSKEHPEDESKSRFFARIFFNDDVVHWIGNTPSEAIAGACEARAANKRISANKHHNL